MSIEKISTQEISRTSVPDELAQLENGKDIVYHNGEESRQQVIYEHTYKNKKSGEIWTERQTIFEQTGAECQNLKALVRNGAAQPKTQARAELCPTRGIIDLGEGFALGEQQSRLKPKSADWREAMQSGQDLETIISNSGPISLSAEDLQTVIDYQFYEGETEIELNGIKHSFSSASEIMDFLKANIRFGLSPEQQKLEDDLLKFGDSQAWQRNNRFNYKETVKVEEIDYGETLYTIAVVGPGVFEFNVSDYGDGAGLFVFTIGGGVKK